MPLVDPITMSALAQDASAQAADSKPKAAIAAVPTFNNALSKGVSFGRVAVLLGLLAAQFNELVAQPALTLQSAVPVVAVVQVAYVVLCLPAAGSQQAKAAKKPRPGEKKKSESAGTSSLVVRKFLLNTQIEEIDCSMLC
jgi:phosphatidylinositol glycan class F